MSKAVFVRLGKLVTCRLVIMLARMVCHDRELELSDSVGDRAFRNQMTSSPPQRNAVSLEGAVEDIPVLVLKEMIPAKVI